MTNKRLCRPDLAEIEKGAIYVHSDTGEFVEFIGTAWMTELAGEDVGVFRFIEGECLIATRHGYQQGETFEPVGDVVEEELENEEEQA